MPRIPGIERFRGAQFHSARWNHDYALDGRRTEREARTEVANAGKRLAARERAARAGTGAEIGAETPAGRSNPPA